MIDKNEFDRLDKLDKSVILAIIIIVFLLLTQNSEAQVYQFNSSAEPSYGKEKTQMQFKAEDPAKADAITADPVNNTPNEQPYTGYVGYPRFQLGLIYAPTSTGFKQEYNSLPLNFSSTSYSSVNVIGRFLFNPNLNAEVEYDHSAFSVSSKDLGTYQVQSSTANIDTVLGRVVYCDVLSHALNKICYGGVAGLDAFPSLSFTSSTDLEITSIKDMVVGALLGYQRELGPFTSLNANLEYLFGLRQGQNSDLGVDSDSSLKAKIDFNFLSQKSLNYFSAGAEYCYRDAKVHGTTGSFTDNWATKASSFALKVGYTWTWNNGF